MGVYPFGEHLLLVDFVHDKWLIQKDEAGANHGDNEKNVQQKAIWVGTKGFRVK